ncbi:hypothetical protein HRbin04_00016 [archaeon HR04]|nr:hypothetical protein HRbin04_00016 [archaeon HR04]
MDIVLNSKPYTDMLILDELIYISMRKYGVEYSVSIEFIESIVRLYI